MRVHLTHLGCKLNQAELETLARELTAVGHEVVDELERADLHVVNTCTVTHRAARDSRKLARRGQRFDPRIRTVLTGCYASEKPAEAAGLDGVDLVVTNDRKEHLVPLIRERFGAPALDPAFDSGNLRAIPFGHTRALVKIEDGCNMRCAFCIIPATRGRQRSRPVPEVVAEVDALARAGAREVVVTGVQISHYRWRGHSLYELVSEVLAATAGLGPAAPRLRLTSIAPWRFDDRLLDLFMEDRSRGAGSSRLCRHVHLSLQSGSTATLRRMRRPYTAQEYADLVERLRAAVPGIAVTTDVIVGFPGETDEEFEESLAFVREMAFARPHVFPYSVREGTEAADLPDPVPHEVRRERMARMLELAAELERSFRRRNVGERLEVLWEQRRDGAWLGTTDNYLRVRLDAEPPEGGGGSSAWDLTGRRSRVEITGLREHGVVGRLTEPVPAAPRVPGIERAGSPPASTTSRSLLPVLG